MAEHVWEPAPGEGPHGEYTERCSFCGILDCHKDADRECAGSALEFAFNAGFDAGWNCAHTGKSRGGYMIARSNAWKKFHR